MADKAPTFSKIVVDRNLCIGAGTCVALAPDVFELDSDNKAVVTNPTGMDEETIRAAAESCPVLAIYLYDKNGNQTFPKKTD